MTKTEAKPKKTETKTAAAKPAKPATHIEESPHRPPKR
jgi:hypothetical protein